MRRFNWVCCVLASSFFVTAWGCNKAETDNSTQNTGATLPASTHQPKPPGKELPGSPPFTDPPPNQRSWGLHSNSLRGMQSSAKQRNSEGVGRAFRKGVRRDFREKVVKPVEMSCFRPHLPRRLKCPYRKI